MIEAGRRAKVAHLTSVHAATDTRIVYKECATLAREGYEVVLIAPGPERALGDGVRHHAVPTPRNRIERFAYTIPAVYRAAIGERADVYHFHDPELVPVGLLLRASGARVIFDVHEDVPLDIRTKPWIPAFLRPALSGLAAAALRGVQRFFTAIVPATPSIAQAFTHRRTVVVRNYPMPEEFAVEDGFVPIARRPMTALYLGNLTSLRGAEQMVRAMEYSGLPENARLLLLGAFEDDALRARCAAFAGWRRVDAPGLLPRQALSTAVAGARIGLLVLQPAPNHTNSLPTKFFEYMGAGLPVISSNFLEASRDLVTRYECGVLVDPRDSEQIGEAMTYLFTHPHEAQAMGERGRQAVREQYEWTSEARSLVGLYREIAS